MKETIILTKKEYEDLINPIQKDLKRWEEDNKIQILWDNNITPKSLYLIFSLLTIFQFYSITKILVNEAETIFLVNFVMIAILMMTASFYLIITIQTFWRLRNE